MMMFFCGRSNLVDSRIGRNSDSLFLSESEGNSETMLVNAAMALRFKKKKKRGVALASKV